MNAIESNSQKEASKWDVATGEQVTTLITKGASPRWQGFAYGQSGMLFVTSENVREGYLDLSKPKYLPLEFHKKIYRSRIQKGDILINLVGASIGRSCLVREGLGEANINQAVAVFRPVESADGTFLSYYFQLPETIERILGMQVEAARPNISLTDLRNFELRLPSIKEQRAIAEALSDADALIEGLERLIAKKRLIKQGAMQELLTGKRRLPGFSGEWLPLSLAASSHLKARIGWQGLTTQEYRKFGEYTLVTGTDIFSGRVNWRGCVFVDKWRYDQDRNIQLQDGDILLTKDGTIGKVARVENMPGPAALNSGVFVIRPKNESYHAGFAFHILRSSVFEDFLAKLTAGSTIVHLYQKDLVTFNFAAPGFEEQKAISDVLDNMDAEIQALQTRLEKARLVKEGMMQTLLTGQIRLV